MYDPHEKNATAALDTVVIFTKLQDIFKVPLNFQSSKTKFMLRIFQPALKSHNLYFLGHFTIRHLISLRLV